MMSVAEREVGDRGAQLARRGAGSARAEYVRRIALRIRVEPDWSGRWTCSQTASHSAIASITGARKSFGCGLVKRIRSMPSTASHGAQQLAELGRDVRHAGRVPTS